MNGTLLYWWKEKCLWLIKQKFSVMERFFILLLGFLILSNDFWNSIWNKIKNASGFISVLHTHEEVHADMPFQAYSSHPFWTRHKFDYKLWCKFQTISMLKYEPINTIQHRAIVSQSTYNQNKKVIIDQAIWICTRLSYPQSSSLRNTVNKYKVIIGMV